MADKIPINLNDDIFDAMGLGGLDSDKKGELYVKMEKIVEQRVNLSILGMLSEADRMQLAEINEADVGEFLEKRGINLGEVVIEVTQAFREEMIGDMDGLMGRMEERKRNPEA